MYKTFNSKKRLCKLISRKKELIYISFKIKQKIFLIFEKNTISITSSFYNNNDNKNLCANVNARIIE